MQNKLHHRPTNYNADSVGNTAIATTKAPRPASMYAPRGGQRYKPRPKPRRHHLPCIVPLPGAAAATHDTPQTKATLPYINLRYKAGWLYFLLQQNLEAGPNGYHITTPICDHYKQNTTPANLTEPSCRPLKPEQYGQYADLPCQAYTYHISDMYNCPAP